MTDYPAPQLYSPVVSTQWLADHLGADRLVVVDTTVIPGALSTPGSLSWASGADRFAAGQVPGAVFADLLGTFAGPDGGAPFARPSATRFEAATSALGIDNATTVIVYDAADGRWACRLWWLFRTFGYDSVAVLDGGLPSWTAEGRTLGTGLSVPHPSTFTAHPREHLWVDRAYVDSVVAGLTDAALLGTNVPADGALARPVRVPGSVEIAAADLVAAGSGEFLGERMLRERLAPALGRRVVAFGSTGAVTAALALALIGEHDVALFDGAPYGWMAEAVPAA
ncbi:MAG: hypothetical protein H7146_00055 [Burkholderiaceae bacterium]|nr:hypothetical protein [Microbacteriaceae bacterium]